MNGSPLWLLVHTVFIWFYDGTFLGDKRLSQARRPERPPRTRRPSKDLRHVKLVCHNNSTTAHETITKPTRPTGKEGQKQKKGRETTGKRKQHGRKKNNNRKNRQITFHVFAVAMTSIPGLWKPRFVACPTDSMRNRLVTCSTGEKGKKGDRIVQYSSSTGPLLRKLSARKSG